MLRITNVQTMLLFQPEYMLLVKKKNMEIHYMFWNVNPKNEESLKIKHLKMCNVFWQYLHSTGLVPCILVNWLDEFRHVTTIASFKYSRAANRT